VIKISDIEKSYSMGEARIPVLRGVSLEIGYGDFVAIMGPSGSGKSTLLNIIGCLDIFDKGDYFFAGQSITDASEDQLAEIRNGGIGFVFQSFNLIPRISACRNVELPLIYSLVPKSEHRRRALESLECVGLKERAEHAPNQLSGGQQQRVAIARALINNPNLIVADEPTGSLDTGTSREIMKLLCQLHQSGKTIVMVTHEDEIADYAQRTIRLRDGRIVAAGETASRG
jgi:putative ABC transport system ATP-binding protein